MAVLWSGEALAAGEPAVGGKALGLARLVEAGARVPEWFVVPATSFLAHLDAAGLRARVGEALAVLDAASERAHIERVADDLRLAIETAPLAEAVAAAVRAALAQLGDGPYAVRSSMIGEDSAQKSFAGQCDTYLFQRDADEVLASVRRAWGSAFTARALAYRLRGGDRSVPAMAVVVQRMIDGRVSGVLFTANPVSRRRDELLLSAAWGLGEGVVSGTCNADEYVLSPGGDERSSRVADKDVRVVVDASGRGTMEDEVPADQRAVRCLTPAQTAELAREGARLQEHLGQPLDVEWTLDARGQLYLLQARPITSALAPAPAAGPADHGQRVVWNNSNIQESYCGVTTPLTFSVVSAAYASVYEQTLVVLGLDEAERAAFRPMLRRLLGLVRGRVFYNINNWYRYLLILPSFGRNKADMERMMGLDVPIDFIEDQVLTLGEKLWRAPKLAMTLARLKHLMGRLDRDVPQFLAEFERIVGRVDRPALASWDLSRLLTLARTLRSEVIDRWHTPIIGDFRVMMASGKLRRLIEKAVGAERQPEMWAKLVAGEEGIESTEPTRILLRLAKRIRARPEAAEALRSGTPAEALARLRRDFPDVDHTLTAYLERYGDRAMGELKLETISLREDPSFLIKVLRGYLDRPDLDPDALAARERAERDAAERELAGKLAPLDRLRLPAILRECRDGIKARENMRLARTRIFGVWRDIYRAVGHRLHEAGLVDEPRDVFYLTDEEIFAYHDGTAVTTNLAALARLRKAEFAAYAAEDIPNHFETVGAPYLGLPAAAPAPSADARAQRVLRGLGCSQGAVEGQLRVIRSPDDDLELSGRILTALRTDPGWGPLFPSAAGILVERGSQLSHSAVLARELGIPAVVGVPNLLAIVRDGERVRLDGAAGTVERQEVGDGR
jgi:pyruvate,water dikinase